MTSKQPHGGRSPELQALLNEAARRDAALESAGSGPATATTPFPDLPHSGDRPGATASESGDEPPVPPMPVDTRISGGTSSSNYPVLVARAALQAADRLAEIHSPAPAPPHKDRRRAFVLAGGVAAAVVAIVAVTVRGAPETTSNDAPVDRTGAAVVRSTGSDGKPSQPTVTASMSTVGGQLVALVTNADGSISRLPVLTVLPSTPAAGTGITTRSADTSTSKGSTERGAPVSVLGTARTESATGTTTGPGTTSLAVPQATAGSAARTGSSKAAPTPPGDDETATVIPGVTKLTGWIAVPTVPTAGTSEPAAGAPQTGADTGSSVDRTRNAVGASTGANSRPTGAASATASPARTNSPTTSTAPISTATITPASNTAAPTSTAGTAASGPAPAEAGSTCGGLEVPAPVGTPTGVVLPCP